MANDKQELPAAGEQPIKEKGLEAQSSPEQMTQEEQERLQQLVKNSFSIKASEEFAKNAADIVSGIDTSEITAKVQDVTKNVLPIQEEVQKTINKVFGNPDFMSPLRTAIQNMEESAKKLNSLISFLSLQQDEKTQSLLEAMFVALCENVESIPEWLDDYEEMEALEPFLQEELEKPEYQGLTGLDLIKQSTDENGQLIPGSPAARALEAARIARDAQNILPKLQSAGTSKYFFSPNTALSNALTGDSKGELIGAGAVDLPVLAIGRKDETTIYAMATLENMEGVEITGKPWSYYDKAIWDAAWTISVDRIKRGLPPLATSDMIYRQMTNKRAGEYVSPQQRGAVTKSIEKQRRNIRVSVDASEEMKRRKITVNDKPVTKFVKDDFILPAQKLEIQAGGETVTAYLFGNMVLGEYAQLTGQVTTIKTELLDIKEVKKTGEITDISLSNSANRIAIKSYLLRRIKQAEHDDREYQGKCRKYEKDKAAGKDAKKPKKPNSNIILFETVYTNAEIKDLSSSRRDAQKYIMQVLDFWKAAGMIKDFKKRKREKGKGYDAVIVEF